MKAKDLMSSPVITVPPDMPARDIARCLIKNGISAVPVVDESGAPLGIVSEGDLLGRTETDREARRDWWLALAAGEQAADLLSSLGNGSQTAREIMVSPVLTVGEEMDSREIARMLASYRIKRVPVVRHGRVVGVVSRADLLQAVANEPLAGTGEKPHSALGRAFASLDEHFHAHSETPSLPAAPPTAERPEARDFRRLNEDYSHHEDERRQESRRAALEQREHRIADLNNHHLEESEWWLMLDRAREAAKAGHKEYLLMRFPSQLCSDGGRAINVAEAGWPSTLHGEPAEIYLRWERDLKAKGFHLSAQILDFPNGFPGDVGLYLTWED
jgi:CBS domain-containing protein